jgi:hypothetical protein
MQCMVDDKKSGGGGGNRTLVPVNTNPMMANDFGYYGVKAFELPRRFESPGRRCRPRR